MRIVVQVFGFSIAILLFTFGRSVASAEIRVGVASNFSHTAKLLSAAYTENGNHTPKLLFASTGKHAAQVQKGLPIQLLLAADKERPKLLVERGFGLVDTRQTYAIGSLAFWTQLPSSGFSEPLSLIESVCAMRATIAIANPKFAPYGVAARQILNSLSQNKACNAKLIIGENVSQTVHFAKSGFVDAAFIPMSMTQYLTKGTSTPIPTKFHAPIEQQMLLLNESPEAKDFYVFMLSDQARAIIKASGYILPDD